MVIPSTKASRGDAADAFVRAPGIHLSPLTTNLAENENARASRPRRSEIHLERATAAVDLAKRIADRIAPLSVESVSLQVLALYREAAFWALTADDEGPLPSTPSAALGCVDGDVLLAAAGDEISLARVRDALARTFVASADLGAAQRLGEIHLLEGFVRGLVEKVDPPRSARRRNALRRSAPLAIASAVVLVVIAVLLRPPRDLAAHRPWRASSTFKECDLPNNTCAGAPVDIFFHTEEEDSPWVEVDLGKVETFSTVVIRNRLDCCQERAVPLVIEVSTDGASYTQVARRDDPFSVWDLRFPAVRARYVRARVLRRTMFHLERISVR